MVEQLLTKSKDKMVEAMWGTTFDRKSKALPHLENSLSTSQWRHSTFEEQTLTKVKVRSQVMRENREAMWGTTFDQKSKALPHLENFLSISQWSIHALEEQTLTKVKVRPKEMRENSATLLWRSFFPSSFSKWWTQYNEGEINLAQRLTRRKLWPLHCEHCNGASSTSWIFSKYYTYSEVPWKRKFTCKAQGLTGAQHLTFLECCIRRNFECLELVFIWTIQFNHI